MKRLMICGVLIAVMLLVIPVAVAATTVTVFLHNDQQELTDHSYFINIAGIGRKVSGDTFTVSTPADITYVAWTGPSLRGPPVTTHIDVGQAGLLIEYATVTVGLTGWSGVPLTDKSTYYLVIPGIGTVGTGDVFHVPRDTQITYQACTNSICGPYQYTDFDSGAQVLDYEYSRVVVRLYNKDTDLTDRNVYYLDVEDIGMEGTNNVFFVPADSVFSYRAHTGADISGPTQQVTFGAGNQELAYEYATVKARLFSGSTELTDAKYYLEIQDIGNVGYNGIFHVPKDAVISYRACTGTTLCGPWLTASFPAGEQTFTVEYAAVMVKIYNGATQLLDKTKYYLEITGIGNLGYGEVFFVPADGDFTFRAWTGTTVSGPWVPARFGAGNRVLSYEYASVKFVFDLSGGSCLLQTQVTGIGNVPNGGKVHVPDNADVSFRADVCGWLSGVKTIRFYSGEGTVKWSMTATYTRP